MWAFHNSIFVAYTATFLICFTQIPGSAADYYRVGLEEHNKLRSKHGSGDMEFDQKMNQNADKCAQYYADQNMIDHKCPFKENAGENLHMGWGGNPQDPEELVKSAVSKWYSEIKDYDFSKNNFEGAEFYKIGHFTQVVWKGSKKLGIGHAKNAQKNNYVTVGLYSPPGNVMNNYEANVPKPQDGQNIGFEREVDASKNASKSDQNSTVSNTSTVGNWTAILLVCLMWRTGQQLLS